jgi:hypothetical protein
MKRIALLSCFDRTFYTTKSALLDRKYAQKLKAKLHNKISMLLYFYYVLEHKKRAYLEGYLGTIKMLIKVKIFVGWYDFQEELLWKIFRCVDFPTNFPREGFSFQLSRNISKERFKCPFPCHSTIPTNIYQRRQAI